MNKIKYWRLKHNLTRIQLAEKIKTSPGYVYEIETFKKDPSLKMIHKIADVFEVCFKELLQCSDHECDNCDYNCGMYKEVPKDGL